MVGKAKPFRNNNLKPEAHELDEQGKKILAMLTALEDEDNLNDWELQFVSDISYKFYSGKVLSPKQFDKLKQVYDKYN